MNLFPAHLPELEWTQFRAAGFDKPVCGAIYTNERHPCCGVPLGGLSTGCIDIDARGVYGFSSIFHPISPRYEHSFTPCKAPSFEPILGLSMREDDGGHKSWVLAAKPLIEGGQISSCENPAIPWGSGVKKDIVHCPNLADVRPAQKIRYWGHYPVADLEFETDAPISLSMRAWSPLIPGDAAASNIPAAVFEIHLHNPTQDRCEGVLVFNFPGPDTQEARVGQFTRRLVEEDFSGVLVSSQASVQYVLGVIDDSRARFGAGLNGDPKSWSRMGSQLPRPVGRESHGTIVYSNGSCSAAVDFSLSDGESKVVHFFLAWYAPVWEGGHKEHAVKPPWAAVEIPAEAPPEQLMGAQQHELGWIGSDWAGETHYYTPMYASR